MSKKYFDIFLRESREHLGSLQHGLLLLEKEPDNRELVHDILRNAHTIKGSARMLGFDGISSIAHAMEDFLKEVDSGGKSVDDFSINRLLKGCDAIAALTAALAADEPQPFDVEQFLATCMDENAFTTPVSNPPADPSENHPVKVSADTLDRMINLAEELFICRQRLEDRLESIKKLATAAAPTPLKAKLKLIEHDFEDDLLQMHALIQLCHGEALSLRMLPLNSIIDDFQRTVRDLARSVGKDVRLEIRGGQTELDRGVMEALKPAMLHIINNAIVHGIEPPELRVSSGKPQHGTIRITATHKGNQARITIRDDGQGMDPDRIRNRGIELGLLDPDSANALDNNEALYLALRHGFSTADSVTDLAGRGIGLDVVNSILDKVRGNITLASEPGRFFEISVQLPVTLSLIPALIVNCSDEIFAIPVSYVEEIIKIRESDICRERDEVGIYLHGAFFRLFSLSAILGLPILPLPAGTTKLPAIVLGLAGESIVFSVDAILREDEIVVKGFGQQLRHADFFKGATILRNGTPTLILDIHDIFTAASSRRASAIGEFSPSRSSSARGTILIVDDSITSRTIEQSILSANGYIVETADSAESALRKLAVHRFDLMISDMEMPGMSGPALVKKVLAMPEYSSLPVVMISSLVGSEDLSIALEAGARAYISKGDFDQGVLLSLVRDLIDSGAPRTAPCAS